MYCSAGPVQSSPQISDWPDYHRRKFSCFSWFFRLNRKSFPVNYGLVNQQYKSTNATAKVFMQVVISTQNSKVVPAEVLLHTVLLKMWTHIMDPYSLINHSGQIEYFNNGLMVVSYQAKLVCMLHAYITATVSYLHTWQL